MLVTELPQRSRDIFSLVVEAHLRSGQPVGSRMLTGGINLSAATIRNSMQDLEDMGLLFSQHTSAGRKPTASGLRFYIDHLMQVEALSPTDQQKIEAECRTNSQSPEDVMTRASATLSSLSRWVSVVLAPQSERPLQHIGFTQLSLNRVMAILVTQDGHIENRLIDTPVTLQASDLERVSNYLNARILGKTLQDARRALEAEHAEQKAQFSDLQSLLIDKGISLDIPLADTLVVRGQSALLEDVKTAEQIARARDLIAALEEKKFISDVLDMTRSSQNVQIFVGAENRAIPQDWSMIAAPYYDANNKHILGVVGVIGPTSIDYRKVVPIVGHTSQVVKNILGRLTLG